MILMMISPFYWSMVWSTTLCLYSFRRKNSRKCAEWMAFWYVFLNFCAVGGVPMKIVQLAVIWADFVPTFSELNDDASTCRLTGELKRWESTKISAFILLSFSAIFRWWKPIIPTRIYGVHTYGGKCPIEMPYECNVESNHFPQWIFCP